MSATISRLYNKSKDPEIVSRAVTKGWITEDEANEILGKKGMSEATCYETVWKIYNEVLSK